MARCYSPQVVYWMPAWGDDDQRPATRKKRFSHIYYPNREGLEDRVYRIKTERSGASTHMSRGPPISSATLSCWAKATRVWRCVTAGSPGAIAISTRMPILASLLHAN